MIKYFLILLYLLGSKISLASYTGTSLTQLVETAKVICYGKIIAVENGTFKLIILRPIKACRQNDTISIRKFANWTCASRYAEYSTYQEGVFFLSLYEGKLATIGAANEGELIVKEGIGYIQNYDQHVFKAKKIDFISKYQEYICINLQTIIDGLKIYLENQETIDRQFAQKNDRERVAYQYNYTDKLPKNDFLDILIDQKQRGFWTIAIDGR